jgi:hypothetical protein
LEKLQQGLRYFEYVKLSDEIKISPITGPGRPRGFLEVKASRFRENGTGWW